MQASKKRNYRKKKFITFLIKKEISKVGKH